MQKQLKNRDKWEVFELYNGDVTIEYMDSKHWYKLAEAKMWDFITSATGATGIYDKSRALIAWALRTDFGYLEEYINAEDELHKDIVLQKIEEAKVQHDRAKEKAGTIGDITHGFAEAFTEAQINELDLSFDELFEIAMSKAKFDLETVEPDYFKELKDGAMKGINAFLDWYNAHDVEIHSAERLIYSKEYGYTGRNDFVATIDGVYTIGDYKTSSGVYDDMQWQLSAYWHAIEEEDQHCEGKDFKPFEQGLILQFDKETGDFNPHYFTREDHEKNFPAFVGCLAVKNRAKEMQKEWRKKQKELSANND